MYVCLYACPRLSKSICLFVCNYENYSFNDLQILAHDISRYFSIVSNSIKHDTLLTVKRAWTMRRLINLQPVSYNTLQLTLLTSAVILFLLDKMMPKLCITVHVYSN